MNKIKFLYDVVNTMKEKDVVQGTLKAEGKKDEAVIFNFQNEFERDMINGRIKAKVATQMDYEGKKVKHESTTEFNMEDGMGHMHHGYMGHMHHHGHHCGKSGGIKAGLNRAAFMLSVLNNLKVEEKGEGGFALSLNLKDMPEDIIKTMKEKMSHRAEYDHEHQHHEYPGHQMNHLHPGLFKEMHDLDDRNIELNVLVNKNYEIEKISIVHTGEKVNVDGTSNKISMAGEVNFFW